MTLIIHRGACQIGGNFVEVATDNTRIILDVGLPLEDLEKPRTSPRGKDPLIQAVFGKHPPVAAILLSHAHADHSGLLEEVSETPVYLTEGTSMMLLAGSVYAKGVKVPKERQVILEHRRPVQIGDITVTAHPVDHSAFDSVALEIEADGKRILYSGDLRLHGRKPGMAKALIANMTGKQVDALLMEGTHFSGHREPGPTEEELQQLILRDIESAPGLVLASFSPMHIDRLVTFYKATRNAGRHLVVDHYGGFVLHLVSKIASIPKPRSRNFIRVFLPKLQKRIEKIEKCFREPQIRMEEILADPKQYVLLFRPSMIEHDFGNKLPDLVRLIYSYWSGYLPKSDWQTAQRKVAEANGDFVQRHTSGHIHAEDIPEFVAAINPRTVIPIHTSNPTEFIRLFPNARLLEDGEAWSGSNELTEISFMAPFGSFQDWSNAWTEARKNTGAVDQVLNLWKANIPGDWQREGWDGGWGYRMEGTPRGEQVYEKMSLGILDRLKLLTLVRGGLSYPTLTAYHRFPLSNQKLGQVVADVLGVILAGGRLRPLLIEIKVTADNPWYAMVECLKQVSLARSRKNHILVCEHLATAVEPVKKGAWGVVAAPKAYFLKDREVLKRCGELMDALKEKTLARIAFVSVDDLTKNKLRWIQGNWSGGE